MSSIHTHSERSARTGICIVWPAWFPGSIDRELHATALFLGTTDTVGYQKEDVLAAMSDQYLWPGWVKTTGFKYFGRENDVPVFTLERTNLLTITRQHLKTNLERRGIFSSTLFPFNPHVTIAKEKNYLGRVIEPGIHLESPVLWWGDDRTLHSGYTNRQEAAA